MKTLRPFKNRRLTHAVRNHAGSSGFIAQIGIVLQQCFHADNLPDPAFLLKPVLTMNPTNLPTSADVRNQTSKKICEINDASKDRL